MASKVFMGNMPEIMEKILNNLNNEFYSLHSCALVSRLWCKMSIPILWQDPFSFSKNRKESSFISNYFSSLGNDEKSVLRKCGINAEFSETLFNYASFLKVLDLYYLKEMVIAWFYFQPRLECYLFDRNESLYHIINLLFKLLIVNGATLHKLDLYFYESILIKPEIFGSLRINKKFFSSLQDLYLGKLSDKSATNLLKILAKNARKISDLTFEFYTEYKPKVFQALVSLIKSQEQLRLFKIFSGEDEIEEYHGIISALESQKRSLREVVLEYCNYSEEFKVLMNCENLEILRVNNIDYKLLDIFVYNNKIRTLDVYDSIPIKASHVISFLEKSGALLQQLIIYSDEVCEEEESSLLKALISKSLCLNITYLDIAFGISTLITELIGKLKKLQFLTVWLENNITEEEIKKFAEILPLTLQYLDLKHTQLNTCLCILLNNCYAPLKRLLIDSIDEKQAKALVEFCMRKRRLDYVGVLKYSDLNDNIKKEMEKYVTIVPSEYISSLGR